MTEKLWTQQDRINKQMAEHLQKVARRSNELLRHIKRLDEELLELKARNKALEIVIEDRERR